MLLAKNDGCSGVDCFLKSRRLRATEACGLLDVVRLFTIFNVGEAPLIRTPYFGVSPSFKGDNPGICNSFRSRRGGH